MGVLFTVLAVAVIAYLAIGVVHSRERTKTEATDYIPAEIGRFFCLW